MALSVVENRQRLEHYLRDVLPAERVQLEHAEKLRGGAIQQNWLLDLDIEGGPESGRQRWVLRTNAETTLEASRGRPEEFAILTVVRTQGLRVPRPIHLCENREIIGNMFFLMQFVNGEGRGAKLVRKAEFTQSGEQIVAELGRQAAMLHDLVPPVECLEFIDEPVLHPALARIEELYRLIAGFQAGQPVIELALRWLSVNLPPVSRIVLVHGDLRTGNYLVDLGEVKAILDWEFACFSDPLEDLGWMLARCWRFGQYERQAGGLGDGETFLAAYEKQSGHDVDRSVLPFWQLLATTRWAVIALRQAARAYQHGENSLELALTAEIVPSLEWDILDLFDLFHAERPNERTASDAFPDAESMERGEVPSCDGRTASLLRIAQIGFQQSIRPKLQGEDRFSTAMIARALDVSVRRVSDGPEIERLERQGIARLIGSLGNESLPELRSELCKLIRRGGFDGTASFAIRAEMRNWVEQRLSVSDPGYLRSLERCGISGY